MQVFLILEIVVLTLILLGVNVYLLTLYIHPDDKKLSAAPYAKIIIVIGLTLCQLQSLMISLDVIAKDDPLETLSDQTLKMGTFWLILYCILLAVICVIIPYAIFFYESDPETSIPYRLARAFAYLFVTLIVSCMVLFITWAFLKYTQIPCTQIKSSKIQDQTTAIVVSQTSSSLNFQGETSFPVYVMAIMAFCGWFLLVFFGGVGLFALPADLINQFKNRPKVRKSEQMKEVKKKLCNSVKDLMREGQNIKLVSENYEKNEQAGCLQKFKSSRKSNTDFTRFKVKYHMLSEQFQIFNLQLKLADTNPIIPYIKLVIGFIFILTSILWIVQIIVGSIVPNYKNKQVFPFVDSFLTLMDAKGAGIFSIILFAYLVMYMMWCVQKGSIKMGMRIPFVCRFYPLTQAQTALNGFMVNVLFMIFASAGVIQLCIGCFPVYTRNTQILQILGVQVKYMKFYSVFAKYSIFQISLLCWAFLTLLYVLITCNKRPKYLQQIESIRAFHKVKIEQTE